MLIDTLPLAFAAVLIAVVWLIAQVMHQRTRAQVAREEIAAELEAHQAGEKARAEGLAAIAQILPAVLDAISFPKPEAADPADDVPDVLQAAYPMTPDEWEAVKADTERKASEALAKRRAAYAPNAEAAQAAQIMTPEEQKEWQAGIDRQASIREATRSRASAADVAATEAAAASNRADALAYPRNFNRTGAGTPAR